MEEYRRPSTWAAALGVGLLAVAVALLGGEVPARAVLLGLGWAGGTLAALQAVPLVLWLIAEGLALARDWQGTFRGEPAAESEPDEVADDATTDDKPDYLPAWRAAAHRFVTAGNLYGFKVRDIGAGEHEVIGWDEWGLMRDFLIEAGVLSARGGTHWADNWSWPRWQREYAAMPLPPVSGKPPEVKLTVNKAQQHRQQQAEQAAEGVRAD